MKSLSEKLRDFVGQIAVATTDAPDEYPEWSDGYAAHMADLQALWSEIRPQLYHDAKQAQWVDDTLREMIAAFDVGEKDAGRRAAWALYNAELSKLR